MFGLNDLFWWIFIEVGDLDVFDLLLLRVELLGIR